MTESSRKDFKVERFKYLEYWPVRSSVPWVPWKKVVTGKKDAKEEHSGVPVFLALFCRSSEFP